MPALFLIALVLSLPVPGAGPPTAIQLQVPAYDGWVTDLAGLLTDNQEAELESLMESYRAGTTHEIALLTVPSLEGASLDQFSLEVARGWGLGGKDANNGALLVISQGDRRMRIEVGRGLEGTLTDSISGRIIRDVIAPHFKAGRSYEGISEGIRAIHAAIGGDYGALRRTARGRNSGSIWIMLVFLLIFFFMMKGGGGIRRRRSGMGPIWWTMGGLGGLGGGRGGFGGGLGGGGGGGFGGFGGGGGFSGGGASGGW